MRFHGASFAGYSEGLVGVVRQAGAILGIVLSICGVLWAILIRVKRGKDAVGRGTVVPEYLPLKDVSVLFASDFYGGAAHALPAQMIDLAVRKKIQIIEEEKKGVLGSSKKYSVKSINTDNLNQHEKACMEAIFGSLELGVIHELKSSDASVSSKLQTLTTTVKSDAFESGYRRKVPGVYRPFMLSGSAMVIAIAVFIFYVPKVTS